MLYLTVRIEVVAALWQQLAGVWTGNPIDKDAGERKGRDANPCHYTTYVSFPVCHWQSGHSLLEFAFCNFSVDKHSSVLLISINKCEQVG